MRERQSQGRQANVTKIAINGFGRIGRQFLKAIIERHPEIEIVAVNDLADPKMNALLFKHDSNYGKYPGEVSATDDALLIDGRRIKVLQEKEPDKLPWRDLGVDIVVESTGFFTDATKAKAHLEAGAKKVIISAPAETGAARAVALVIPELKGKFTGISFRVPTPTVSVVDFTAILKREVTKDEVNAAFKRASAGALKGIMDYTEEPLVSSDFKGDEHSTIVSGIDTIVLGNMVKVIAWYDNEWGYSCRLADITAFVASKLREGRPDAPVHEERAAAVR